jgi:hypothetical protein
MKIRASVISGQSNRFDLGTKIHYVKSMLSLGYVPEEVVNNYLSQIYSFNKFYESEPEKKGPMDFLDNFNELIVSMVSEGFRHNPDDPIMISENYELQNAAHRVAVASVLDLVIDVEISKSQFEIFDYNFFIQKQMPKNVLDASMLGSLLLKSNKHVLVVSGIVDESFDEEIENSIKNAATIFYVKKLILERNAVRLLKLLSYFIHGDNQHIEWVGNHADNFSGIRTHADKSIGKNKFRFYVINNISSQQLILLKSELRNLIGKGNFAIHATDSFSEARDILRLICHSESATLSQFRKFHFTEIFEWIRKLRIETDLVGFDREDICIGGSGPLGAYGLRRISDLDIVCEDAPYYDSRLDFVSWHSQLEVDYPSNRAEYLCNPQKTFFFLGFRFVSLSETKMMKKARNEPPKDPNDVARIIRFEKQLDNQFTHRLISGVFSRRNFWTFRYLVEDFFQNSKKVLSQFPYLFRILKKIKIWTVGP